MVHLIWATGGTILVLVAGLLAHLRGGPPERWGAVILLTGWVVSELVDTMERVRIGILEVDLCVLLGFVLLSLKTRRLWTLFAAAFMVNDVACHLIAFLPDIDGWSYITLLGLWGGWLQALALLWGALTARRADIA